jgi:hypothetical protein
LIIGAETIFSIKIFQHCLRNYNHQENGTGLLIYVKKCRYMACGVSGQNEMEEFGGTPSYFVLSLVA